MNIIKEMLSYLRYQPNYINLQIYLFKLLQYAQPQNLPVLAEKKITPNYSWSLQLGLYIIV